MAINEMVNWRHGYEKLYNCGTGFQFALSRKYAILDYCNEAHTIPPTLADEEKPHLIGAELARLYCAL